MKILALFLLVACANKVPTNRSDFRFENQDGFLFSNIYVHPTDIKKDIKFISFDYKIIVKNVSAKERPINLKGASIMIGLRTLPITCVSHKNQEESFIIASEETIGVDCKVMLNKAEGVFQISDYKSIIEIPLDNTKARFAYLLRAEDFQ